MSFYGNWRLKDMDARHKAGHDESEAPTCPTCPAASPPRDGQGGGGGNPRSDPLIRFHIASLKEDGLPVPAPTSRAEYLKAQASRERRTSA
jgi:hypothetical protein